METKKSGLNAKNWLKVLVFTKTKWRLSWTKKW